MKKRDGGVHEDEVASQGRDVVIDNAVAVVTAYVAHNQIRVEELTGLILKVHSTLAELANGHDTAPPVNTTPAVPVKRSVHDDYLVCLEDGKKLTMLKRYLRSQYGMTPEQYRAKWSLPSDYPMVAPAYAKMRSEFAKSIGLGTNSTGRHPRKK